MASIPTNEEVERAILTAINAYGVRGGEIFPLGAIHMKLQSAGYRAAEINDAFQSMADKGWIEGSASEAHPKLTADGYAAI